MAACGTGTDLRRVVGESQPITTARIFVIMEELIEKVRKHPVLYNTSHPDYMKKSVKDSLWQKISAELNYKNGAQVKSLWLKLRNCHRDALRRKESKSGSAATTYKKWKYERQMEFLMKYMANRTTMRNAQDSANVDEESETRQTDDLELMKYEIESNALQDTYDTTDSSFIYTENVTVKSRTPKSASRSEKQKKTNSNINDTVVETLKHEEQAEETTTRRHNASSNEDELYHFYMSMYGITKQLPLHRQIKIKRKIFNAVIEEQEEELCSPATTAMPPENSFSIQEDK